MRNFIKSLFAWREIHDTGVYSYQQNAITGGRRIRRINAGGYQPINDAWLNGGQWDQPRGNLPRGGSAGRR